MDEALSYLFFCQLDCSNSPMQNESQKHDLNSYPFLRHRESFMLFLLNSKYRSNSVITLRFTSDEKHILTKENTEFK